MSDIENLNNAFSTALYKKLNNKLVPLSEKINELEYQTQNISLTPGPRGYRGECGSKGIKGDQGIRGVQGERGLIGEQGEQGIQGIKGERGEKGDKGDQGIKGDQGLQGIKGDKGDQGDRGEQGIKGDKGDQGLQGIKGDRGEQGIQGIKGDQGIQGIKGDQGESGKDGIQGIKGDTGAKGDQGIQGEKGDRGEKGDVGDKGDKGDDGKDGEVPDVEKIIEPLFEKAKNELDSFIVKSDQDFKYWKSSVNTQLSTIGGGGETRLKGLDDVETSSAAVDGQFLKYDSSLNKWVGDTIDLNSIVGAAPETLDTLVELAAAINNDDDFATTIADSIALKADQTDLDTHTSDTTNPHSVTANQVGLGNVTNESKATMFTNPTFTGTINSSGLLDFGDRTSNDTIIRAESDSNDLTLIRAASNSDTVGVSLKYIGSGSGDENIFEIATDGGGSLKIDNSGDVGINTAPIDGIDLAVETFTASGNIGIGTSSPSEKLHVIGKALIDGDLEITGDSSFQNRPTVNGTGVLLIGEGGGGTDVVNTTGDQSISGVKTFLSRLEVSSSTTDDTILITTTEDSSSAAPVITLKRNSSSVSNGDYLGQIKFKGENDADQEVVYAKITAKISDDTDTTEDGLIEYAVKADGSNVIVARQTSSCLKLINGVGLEVDGSATFYDTVTVEGSTTVGKITLSDNSFVTESSSFTLGSTHRGATVLLQNTAPITITVPSQVAGHTTTFIAETINSVTFASGTGLSAFNSFNGANQIAGIFGQAQIIFKTSDIAFLGGNLV